tara:strand:- start:179 stop:652 length:474 start_codon:yes stop_codon:yes gene_type:complete
MIEIKLIKKIIDECKQKSNDIGKLKNSITGGEGNLAGIIGEYIVHKHLKTSEWKNTYNYDLIYNNNKIDVKTKRCNSKPKENYDCSVAKTSLHQNCDEYIFVRILNDFSLAWIVGKKNQKEYFKSARKMVKGQIDPSNNFTVRADCYNLQINELDKV